MKLFGLTAGDTLAFIAGLRGHYSRNRLFGCDHFEEARLEP
jgi:hypothetical protein